MSACFGASLPLNCDQSMCGIAGFVHFDAHKPVDTDLLRRITRVLQHRGPDGEGYWVSGNVGLGHRRLAIIDLQTGDQPMSSADGAVTIVFNGEIYNYLELREELASRGHRFRTSSDTEIILAAYREWGTTCVEHFNGMWAFALWDEHEKKLFCSRDRAGEKPFYYAVAGATFVFGSEIKALFAYGLPKSLDLEVLDAYLCFTYVPGAQTFFKGIRKLRPGHSLVVRAGTVQESAYWELKIAPSQEARTDESRILEEFESLFESSVALRMRSDVPFGAFLSGGLDSSSVVAVMSGISSSPVQTCTIGFDNPAFDERHLARLVANKFHTKHSELLVNPIDADQLLPKLALHYDEPFGDSSALPSYLVSQIASKRVKMVLTGDGGDEVLCGYTIHVGEKIATLIDRLPSRVGKRMLPACATAARRVARGGSKRKLLRLERVVHSSAMDFEDRLESKQSGFSRSERYKLIQSRAARPARDYILEAIRPVRDRDNFTKLNYWLTKVALPDDMLCKLDRASMAHALETRTPFLDHRIIELMANVSMALKLKYFQRKTVLRKTVARRLPPELLSASKRGFAVPLCEWVQRGSVDGLEARAFRAADSGLLSKQALRGILTEHKMGNRDASQAVWCLCMLAEHLS